MCGLAGVIPAARPRNDKELEQISEMFTRLLVLSEHRGPHATGVARVRANGDIIVVKKPVRARDFVRLPLYQEWLESLSHDTTYLMGHTRWPTRGSIQNPANNHPLVSEPGSDAVVALTHNGSILGPDRHFRRLELRRAAQVDSELLLRIAERHAGPSGLDIDGFLRDIEQLDGLMSAAIVVSSKPDEIVLLKGNRPLEVRHHAGMDVLAYASEPEILETGLIGRGWRKVPLQPCSGISIKAGQTISIERFDFRFGQMRDAWLTM